MLRTGGGDRLAVQRQPPVDFIQNLFISIGDDATRATTDDDISSSTVCHRFRLGEAGMRSVCEPPVHGDVAMREAQIDQRISAEVERKSRHRFILLRGIEAV